jgi:ABC-2 type transport system ATP-binding protein
VSVPVRSDRRASDVLIASLRALDAEGIGVRDVAVRRPTLDDVFLTLTGHAAQEHAADDELTPAGAR